MEYRSQEVPKAIFRAIPFVEAALAVASDRKKITITSYWCSTVTLRQVASRRAGLTLIIYWAGRLACMHLKHNSCDGRRHRGRDTTPICYLCGVANGLPKLNTRNCGLYIPHYIQKNHQFLSSIKRDAYKRILVPFFCLTV